jgi:parallel beta-helix repeat protein
MKSRLITVVPIVVLLAAALFLTPSSDVQAASTTCNSCADCNSKLASGSWDTVTLTTDISNHEGGCIALLLEESNVVFDCNGHTIDGDGLAIDPEAGIAMMHGSGNTIRNCTVSDFSEGILLWDATSHVVTGNTLTSNDTGIELHWSDSNDVNNNTITGNYNGIQISNANNNAIDANTVCQSANLDFYLDSGTGNSGDNNTCDSPGSWNDDGTTGCTSGCAGTATCNSCSDCSSKLNGTFDKVMLTQDISNHVGTCITFGANNIEFDGDNHRIDGDDSGSDYGVYLNGKSGNTVKNCDVTDFQYGIYLTGSSGNTVSRSSANSNTMDGIRLDSSSGNTIAVWNEANSNGRFGIYLGYSNNNDVYYNDANSNSGAGIRLSHADSNMITFNGVQDNNSANAWGIYMYSSDSNTVSHNEVVGNYYGIKFDASNLNTLNTNKICSNPSVDFDLVGGSFGNSGDYNTCCASPNEWNDIGTTGCTNPCDTAPDANDNGVSDACDCADARQGLNETGRDCGGICPACLAVPAGWSNVTGVRLRGGANSGLIDVIFVPEQSYSGNMTAFENAVIDNIANWYLRLDEMTVDPLPADYQDKFNFYIYTGGFGQKCTGTPCLPCAGTPPSNLWSDAPGADVGAILAAPGSGAWGCASGIGPPGTHLHFISLGDREGQVLHESGHAIFGLIDQYCGCTHYEQNTPTTNIWSSLSGCQSDATAQGWTGGSCTEINCATPTCPYFSSVQDWWKYDPYSLMDGSGFLCTGANVCTQSPDAFGEACTWRMNWAFNNWPAGSSNGILVHFNINQDVITELSSEMVAGHPDVGLQGENFRVELLSAGDEVLQEYGIWDPRYQIGDGGEMVYSDNVDFSLTFPAQAGIQTAEIYDPATQELKVSVDLSALECTCNSCSDCEDKLRDPLCLTVRLTEDIIDHAGTCIGLIMGESDADFDCDGHTIDGDDIAIDPDYGVTMMHGTDNSIRNCVISDFSRGIYLWDATAHVVKGNTLTSNGAGIEMGWSDAGFVVNNTVNENYNGIVIGNSSNNNVRSNAVCQNTNLDFDVRSSTGNSGTENRCHSPDGWNDDGTTGCTYACPTSLYISPANSTVGVSNTVTVDVMVGDIENLYGAQVALTFDPTLVEVVDADSSAPGTQIEKGSFPVPDYVIVNLADNSAGTIDYAVSLQGAKPGVNGSGVLARITFHGLSDGVSYVAFTGSILSDPQSVAIDHSTQDGQVEVLSQEGRVSGRVILERRASSAGATVSVGTQVMTTDAAGIIGPENIPVGTHTIEARHPSYLRSWRSFSLVAGETLVLPEVTLLGGDVNQDDRIYIGDLTLEGQAWNTTPADAAWFDAGDITDDQAINILDMVAVQYNFQAVAPGPWGTALAQGFSELDRAGTLTSQDRADITTQVVVSPSQASLAGVGEAVELDIAVQDVSDLYGVLLRLTFDPSVVQVRDADPNAPGVQIRPGDFLDPRQFVAVNEADNGTGEILFAVTQLRPAEGQNGSGVLATVIFEAADQGTSPVQLVEVRLLDNTPQDPQEIPAGTQDGEVTVEGQWQIYLPLVLRGF